MNIAGVKSNILISILLASAVLGLTSALYSYNQYAALLRSYGELRRSFSKLEEEYRVLYAMYDSLSDEHIGLKNEYRILEASYSALRISYQRLIGSYEDWRRYALSYLFLEDSISRVLNDSEISNLASLAQSMISHPDDYWCSVKELYDYVRKNVEYVYDPPVPYPPLASDLECGIYVKTTYRQIVLSPSEVLSYKQGDCEDQAILLYALIASYQRYIYGEERILWLIDITLKDGMEHVAVAFPVEEGRLTILDTASSYYTGYPSALGSENPYKELERYSNWFSRYGGIATIRVYDIQDGIPIKVVSGNIYDIAYFLTYRLRAQ
jgi:hypothetical protein